MTYKFSKYLSNSALTPFSCCFYVLLGRIDAVTIDIGGFVEKNNLAWFLTFVYLITFRLFWIHDVLKLIPKPDYLYNPLVCFLSLACVTKTRGFASNPVVWISAAKIRNPELYARMRTHVTINRLNLRISSKLNLCVQLFNLYIFERV